MRRSWKNAMRAQRTGNMGNRSPGSEEGGRKQVSRAVKREMEKGRLCNRSFLSVG